MLTGCWRRVIFLENENENPYKKFRAEAERQGVLLTWEEAEKMIEIVSRRVMSLDENERTSRKCGKSQMAEKAIAEAIEKGMTVHVPKPSGKWPGGLRDWAKELFFRREKPIYEIDDWKDENGWGDEDDV